MRATFAACAAALLGGCGDFYTDVDIRDAAFIPSGRASVALAPQARPPSEPQDGPALEFGITGARGSATQRLSATQNPVRLGGQEITPPADLALRYGFAYQELMYRWRSFSSSHPQLGFEALAGLAHAGLDIRADAPGQSAREKFSGGGVAGAIGVIWKLRPDTSLQARATIAVLPGELFASGARRLDGHLAYALTRHIGVRAGATWCDVKMDGAGSDARLRTYGPSLGLELMF